MSGQKLERLLNLTALLFGRILSVSTGDIVQTAIALVVVLAVLAAIHKELVLRAFAPESARAMGYRTDLLDLALNLLITVFVVAAVKAVGTVLVVALVITPAATAQLWGRSIRSMLAISVAVGVAAGWLGLGISYRASVDHDLRLASGASVRARVSSSTPLEPGMVSSVMTTPNSLPRASSRASASSTEKHWKIRKRDPKLRLNALRTVPSWSQ